MCGITGFLGKKDDNLLHAMCGSLTHRGPDEEGYYSAPGIGLAMRRLAIIDLKNGSQPISNETGDIWVVFNGEIYNYEDLRTQLQKCGHSFRTLSDTETIVHLYEEYGLSFVEHLRGMFSIAIWNASSRELILARDRIGEKPLYYKSEDGQLFFGSEIKAILQVKSARIVDSQAVCDFLAVGYVGSARTIYKSISKLPAGHILVCGKNGISIRKYWQHNYEQTQEVRIPYSTATQELGDRLSETVKLCLKSDVEVGAFLSGGLDSSLIVALMCAHEAKVQTFSVGYSGEAAGFNELSYARRVSDYLGTEHHELILGPMSSIDLLPRILWHYDEPQGEPSSVLVYLLCGYVQKRVKVALSGTGGDEIFFGYPRHIAIRYLEYYKRLPRIIRKRLVEKVLAKWPESTKGSRFAKRAKRFIAGADLPAEEAYLNWVRLFSSDIQEELLSQQTKTDAENQDGDTILREYLIDSREQSFYRRVAGLDVGCYLPDYQLVYMDRMSMAHGLEVRAPFCDYRLVEYVTALPHHYRIKGRRSKRILKDVARELIPHEIVERKKVGFDSPIGQWFKGELRGFLHTFLSSEHIARTGLLDGGKVQTLIGDHLGGRHDYSMQLWSVIMLEAWHRMYIEDKVSNGLDYKITDLRGVEL